MISKNELRNIWYKVPVDYYEKGTTRNPLQQYWHAKKMDTFKLLVGKKDYKKILDVGCATGLMLYKVSKMFPKSQAYGVDVYKKAISFGKKKYPKLRLRTADAHTLPFNTNNFDLVISYETIEHVVDHKKVLKEIKRVLKNGGTAIIVMDSGSKLFRVVWWVWEKTKGKVWEGAHLHPLHHTELEKIIRQSGFKIKRKHFSHFGMEVSFVLTK